MNEQKIIEGLKPELTGADVQTLKNAYNEAWGIEKQAVTFDRNNRLLVRALAVRISELSNEPYWTQELAREDLRIEMKAIEQYGS